MASFTPDHLAVVALWAGDVPATAHFYRDVVGLPLVAGHGPMPAFRLGHGLHLAIVQGQPTVAREPGGSRFPVLAFAVPDLAAAVEHLRQHGVELPHAVETGAAGRWIKFYDPAGNLIEFVQLARSSPARPSPQHPA
jgi:catechol 2,3-dioxygenase-like lactoylglutathione lyase family enzyme